MPINYDTEYPKLQRRCTELQIKVEELEQAIGYVMRAYHYDRPHLPWSMNQLEKAYPNWKDRYPHHTKAKR